MLLTVLLAIICLTALIVLIYTKALVRPKRSVSFFGEFVVTLTNLCAQKVSLRRTPTKTLGA